MLQFPSVSWNCLNISINYAKDHSNYANANWEYFPFLFVKINFHSKEDFISHKISFLKFIWSIISNEFHEMYLPNRNHFSFGNIKWFSDNFNVWCCPYAGIAYSLSTCIIFCAHYQISRILYLLEDLAFECIYKENNGNNHSQIASHTANIQREWIKETENERNNMNCCYYGGMKILCIHYMCTRAHIDVITCVTLFIGYTNAVCPRLHRTVFAFVLRYDASLKIEPAPEKNIDTEIRKRNGKRRGTRRHNVVFGARWCVWIKLLFSSPL